MSKGLMILPIGAGVIGQDDVPLVRIMDSDETPTTITVYGVVDTVQPVTAVTWTVNGVEQSGDVSRSPVLELTNLQPETSYAITLRATNINGESSASARTITTKKITTVTPNDVLDGVSYYNLDVYYTGNIPTKDETDIVVNGRNVTVPTGYYPESETVSVSSEYIIPTGTKNISGNGTEDVTQYAEVNVNVQPPLYSPSNVDPTTSQQTIDVPTGYYGLGPVTINGVTGGIDPNIQAGNIKKDVIILGVTGAFEGGIQPTGTLNIVNNGTYDITNYASVNVNVAAGNFNELCFTAEETNCTVGMAHNGTNATTTKPLMYYSTDNKQTWTEWDYSTITLANIGDKVYFYGYNPNGFSRSMNNYSKFTTSKRLACSGNIMTLITRYGDRETIPSDYCFYDMFYGCTSLTTAPELPATNLAAYCYSYMFWGCTSLTTAPVLPATALGTSCYGAMFRGCTSLTTAPSILPATNLTQYCYYRMFYGCTSLTTAPELPATNLAAYCYNDMFNGCASLTTAPELPATTLAQNCYNSMFQGCTSLTTAPELPATTLANYCYSNMFNGCTSLVNAPIIITTPNSSNCYSNMFNGSTSLDAVIVTCNSWNSSFSSNWMNNVAATGTLYKLPNNTNIPVNSPNGIPTGWTTVDMPYLTDSNEAITFTIPTGWSVYYTTDGTVPTTSSSLYTQPIDVTGLGDKFTLKYISTDNNNFVSPVFEYTYYNMFYIEALEDNTVLNLQKWNSKYSLAYSTDKINWAAFPMTTSYTLANAGDKVYFRRAAAATSTDTGDVWKQGNLNAVTSGTIKVGGCLEYACYWEITGDRPANTGCGNMFQDCVGLVNASDLKLFGAYYYYYSNTSYQYSGMFQGCTSLVTPPALPATTLVNYCYYRMFKDCTSLTTTPELPATTLANNCYYYMFQNCTSLTTAPSILPATTLANYCYSGMFYGCTSLTTAPELPATMATGYGYMFNGCSQLNFIKIGATTWDSSSSTNWVNGVAATGTFIKPTELVIGTGTGQIPSSSANGIPAGWTVEDGTTEPRLYEVSGGPIYRFVITGDWPNDGVTRAVGDIEVYDNNDTLISNSYIEIKVQNGVLDYDDYYWKREYGQRYILSDTGRQLVIETEMDNTGWYTEFDQYYKNCDDWQSRGYSDYEDCMCNENQMDCPPEP